MTKSSTAWIIPAVAILSLFGLFFWQLGIFNINQGSTTSTGFSKIKPQLAAFQASNDGKVNALFTNGAGNKVHINNAQITNLVSGTSCTGQLSQSDVPSGANFQVTANDCVQGFAGDVYNLKFSIEYDMSIGGITATHTESGTVRGPIEPSGSYTGSRGYYQNTPSYGYYDSPYHRSFDFGSWWIVVIILSIVYVLEANNHISAHSTNSTIQLLGVYGFVFLMCSTLILIFGIDHLFNGQDIPTYSLRLRYGWVIECFVYLGIGLILTGLAEHMMRAADKAKTIAAAVLKPTVSLLVLSLMFIYPYRAVGSILSLSMQTKLSEFGWVPEILILGLLAVAYFLISLRFAQGTGFNHVPDLFSLAGSIASLYFIGAVGSFIWGINTLIYGADMNPRGILAAVALVFGGVILLKIGSIAEVRPKQMTIRVKAEEKAGV